MKRDWDGTRVFVLALLLACAASAHAWDERIIVTQPPGGVDFGAQVAVLDDMVLVGDFAATVAGVANAGRVTVYVPDGEGGYVATQHLRMRNPQPNDNFGLSMAVDGDRLIVSVFGRQRAVIYDRVDGVWQAAATIQPAQTLFMRVAISGDRAVLRRVFQAGADVFDRQPDGTWLQTATLIPAAGGWTFDVNDHVAVRGDTVVVGVTARFFVNSGYAAVFDHGPGGWAETDMLEPDDVGSLDAFGEAIGMDETGDTVVVGAPYDNGSAFREGAAFVFARAGGVWSREARLRGSLVGLDSQFGNAVAISLDRIVVGAPAADIDGTETGAAFVFDRTDGAWNETAVLGTVAAHAWHGARFGAAVDIRNGSAALGMPNDDDELPSAVYTYRNP